MYAIVETITPEKARVFLKGNTNNRNLNQHAVRKFASDIKNGLWQENGEAIVVAKDGTLKDGQHRLNAVCLANKPIRSLVVYDVDNTVTEFDRGMNRTLPHLMQLNGYSKKLQRTTVTGAINCLLRVSGHSHASDAQFFTVMSELQEQCMTMADLITSSASAQKQGALPQAFPHCTSGWKKRSCAGSSVRLTQASLTAVRSLRRLSQGITCKAQQEAQAQRPSASAIRSCFRPLKTIRMQSPESVPMTRTRPRSPKPR